MTSLPHDTSPFPHEHHTTRLDGAEARWFARDGVVRVISVTDAGGHTLPLDGADLGACIDHMPRRLWTLVRRRHEAIEEEAGHQRTPIGGTSVLHEIMRRYSRPPASPAQAPECPRLCRAEPDTPMRVDTDPGRREPGTEAGLR